MDVVHEIEQGKDLATYKALQEQTQSKGRKTDERLPHKHNPLLHGVDDSGPSHQKKNIAHDLERRDRFVDERQRLLTYLVLESVRLVSIQQLSSGHWRCLSDLRRREGTTASFLPQPVSEMHDHVVCRRGGEVGSGSPAILPLLSQILLLDVQKNTVSIQNVVIRYVDDCRHRTQNL